MSIIVRRAQAHAAAYMITVEYHAHTSACIARTDVGGFYGSSTPEVMMEEIMTNGPIAIGFEVYNDFEHYKGGVYTHQFTKHLKGWNPFEITNHVSQRE